MREIFTLIALSTLLISCSGGGGGDGGGSSSAAPATTVSGSVHVPNGQIVFNHSPGFLKQLANLFTPSAYASISGQTPVPDGTLVQLARLSATGSDVSILSTTTTGGGRYSFNLTSLGLQYTNDLIIRVSNGPVQMRAFVVSPTVDLDTISETAVRLVMEQLIAVPGATLGRFTVQELADLTGALNVLATAKSLGISTNIEATVTTVRGAAMANPGFLAFLTAAAGVGQTTEGPGDIGNYFPLTQNNLWQYSGSQSLTGQPPPTTPYANTRTITGTKVIGSTTTVVSEETNSFNAGAASQEYLVKNTTGLTIWGNDDVTDQITPQLVPYQALRFPLQPGSTFQPFNKQGLDFGQDLDGDGKNETASTSSQVKIMEAETITVPAGTFPNTIRVETTITLVLTLSGDRTKFSATEVETLWLAPGIGPVKHQDVVQFDGLTTTSIEQLTDVTVDGHGGPASEVKKLILDTNDLIFDPISSKLYASGPGNPGSVAAIDPATGSILSSIPVGTGPSTTGNGPTSLALSDDGHYLYVALNNESAIQRIDLRTFAADLRFTLGVDVVQPQCALQISDMKTLPGNGHALAVSKITMSPPGVSCGENFYEVAIYDDGVQRPTTVRFSSPPSFNNVRVDIERIIFLADPTKLYGFNTGSTEGGFFELAVSGTGISISNAVSLPSLAFQRLIESGSERIYTSGGSIINPATFTIVGKFSPFPNTGQILHVDAISGRVFYLADEVISPQMLLSVYDMASLQLIGTTYVSGSTATQLAGVTSLTRWGTNGLAFRTSNKEVFLVKTVLIP